MRMWGAMTRVQKFSMAVGIAGMAAIGLYAMLPHLLRTGADAEPMNFVAVTERLASSGQPSAAQLRRLRERGYAVVISLAPPESFGSIASEAELIGAQGLVYVNIPVDWQKPSERDFQLFSDVLNSNRDRKVWVHCQMNMRASVFLFLYRVIHDRAPAAHAIEAVQAVWVPNEVWRDFIRSILRHHRIVIDSDILR
jgi:protein tyrosine phosphatase (PTP) superfamily phosphohydrolase (DUF442 family)